LAFEVTWLGTSYWRSGFIGRTAGAQWRSTWRSSRPMPTDETVRRHRSDDQTYFWMMGLLYMIRVTLSNTIDIAQPPQRVHLNASIARRRHMARPQLALRSTSTQSIQREHSKLQRLRIISVLTRTESWPTGLYTLMQTERQRSRLRHWAAQTRQPMYIFRWCAIYTRFA